MTCNRLEHGENRNKLTKECGIGSWSMYDRYTKTERQAVEILQYHRSNQGRYPNSCSAARLTSVQVAYD